MDLSLGLAAASFVLSGFVTAYHVWRYFRRPRFWPTFAEIELQELPATFHDPRPEPRIFKSFSVALAYVGGGRERVIIDSGLEIVGNGGMAPLTHEALHIPAEVAGLISMSAVSGMVASAPEQLECVVRLDSGTEVYQSPLAFDRAADAYRFIPLHRRALPVLGGTPPSLSRRFARFIQGSFKPRG